MIPVGRYHHSIGTCFTSLPKKTERSPAQPSGGKQHEGREKITDCDNPTKTLFARDPRPESSTDDGSGFSLSSISPLSSFGSSLYNTPFPLFLPVIRTINTHPRASYALRA
ncbi:hypothetical protein Cob_v002534 [Colletotrichum orbiculare MAFF 240422]|uniref:Uncharacterized protein n=1 Tax=Colletotrichum orbiculare (strain 104-T / ATCC 96160 / CBS 514.97 / LARS 414 / MAFF 240422) TaxID=1213857 RepID=A0A484G4U8_COLOR|nr:hypothetical protein Cob_v002534 [Colletotrichum orbiculare MAFF 240422]